MVQNTQDTSFVQPTIPAIQFLTMRKEKQATPTPSTPIPLISSAKKKNTHRRWRSKSPPRSRSHNPIPSHSLHNPSTSSVNNNTPSFASPPPTSQPRHLHVTPKNKRQSVLESTIQYQSEQIESLRSECSTERENYEKVRAELDEIRSLYKEEIKLNRIREDKGNIERKGLEDRLEGILGKGLDAERILSQYVHILKGGEKKKKKKDDSDDEDEEKVEDEEEEEEEDIGEVGSEKRKKVLNSRLEKLLCLSIHKVEVLSDQIRRLKSTHDEVTSQLQEELSTTIKTNTIVQASLMNQLADINKDRAKEKERGETELSYKQRTIDELELAVEVLKGSLQMASVTPGGRRGRGRKKKGRIRRRNSKKKDGSGDDDENHSLDSDDSDALSISSTMSNDTVGSKMKKLMHLPGSIASAPAPDTTTKPKDAGEDLALTLKITKDQLNLVAQEKVRLERTLQAKEKNWDEFLQLLLEEDVVEGKGDNASAFKNLSSADGGEDSSDGDKSVLDKITINRHHVTCSKRDSDNSVVIVLEKDKSDNTETREITKTDNDLEDSEQSQQELTSIGSDELLNDPSGDAQNLKQRPSLKRIQQSKQQQPSPVNNPRKLRSLFSKRIKSATLLIRNNDEDATNSDNQRNSVDDDTAQTTGTSSVIWEEPSTRTTERGGGVLRSNSDFFVGG